ncbi:MAG: hypothetical protein ABI175_27730 [Polyangiales bacterium]
MSASLRKTCTGCGVVSPDVGEHELITTRLGWRLSRRLDHNGEIHLDWRCPPCAEKSRRLRALTGQSSGSYPATLPTSLPESDKKKETK